MQKYISMHLELAVEIRLYQRKKGTQFENTFSRQRARYACKIYCYKKTQTDFKKAIKRVKLMIPTKSCFILPNEK